MNLPFALPSSNAPRHVDAAVVGRGAVGAAAALGLSQAGLKVALIGPAPAPAVSGPAVPGAGAQSAPQSTPQFADTAWDPRVFALSPASRALLESLRLWDSLDASRMAPVYDMRVHAGASATAPQLHLDAYRGQVPALAWIVENRNLQGTLDAALRFSPVQSLDERVSGLEITASGPAGRARLSFESGTSLSARFVVAADGIDSSLRSLAGIEARLTDYQQTALVANFECSLPHADTAWQWMDETLGVLALLPLPAGDQPGRVSIVWSAPQALADELLALSPEALAERVSQVTHAALGILTPMGPVRSFVLRGVRVPRLISDRLVLVGDAAHAMHPLAGQGMNLGFGDVAELLKVVRARESIRDWGDPLLWRRYERARRGAVDGLQDVIDGLHRLFGPVPAPLALLRDLGWRAVAASGWARRQLVAQAVR